MHAQAAFELENRLQGLRDFDAAEIVWFVRPQFLTSAFRVRLLCTETFVGFAQVDRSLVSIGLPIDRWIAGRTIIPFGFQKSRPRDYPKACAYSPTEIEELKALADDIYTRVLGPDWRNFPANRVKRQKR